MQDDGLVFPSLAGADRDAVECLARELSSRSVPTCGYRGESRCAPDHSIRMASRVLRGLRASRAHKDTLIAALGDTITAHARWLVRNNG